MHNPYDYHHPVSNDTLFFGREDLFENLLNDLSAPTPKSSVVFGGRRCGKTSLLDKLGRALQSLTATNGQQMVRCYLNPQCGRSLESSSDFFLWVLEVLSEAWETQWGLAADSVIQSLQAIYNTDSVRRGPPGAFIRAFRSLDTRGKRLRLIILLDEAEKIFVTDWGNDLRANLRWLLSDSAIKTEVALVMAGSTQMYVKVREQDSPLENILDRNLLPPLTHNATLSLAQQPNAGRLPECVAEAVWEQSGGQPCIAQFILHTLWQKTRGSVEQATVSDVQTATRDFERVTRHFSAWTKALNANGNAMYGFLLEREERGAETTPYTTLRQHFQVWSIDVFDRTLDTLLYHNLVHCQEDLEPQYYTIGQAYRTWFCVAGRLPETPSKGTPDLRAGLQCLDDVELDTLCLDHFPKVYDQFGQSQRRDAKMNFLLDYVRRNPEEAARLADLLQKQTTGL